MNLSASRKTISILISMSSCKTPCLSQIIAETEMPRNTVCRHLKMLREEYFVKYERKRSKGKFYYKVNSWGVFNISFIKSLSRSDLDKMTKIDDSDVFE